MKFRVTHQSHYSYSTPVALGPHVLRLLPRQTHLTLDWHEFDILPVPVWRQERVDVHGNRELYVEFSGTTSELSVTSRFSGRTSAPGAANLTALEPLPWSHGPILGVHPDVVAFSTDLARAAGGAALPFLERLTRELYESVDRYVRPEGNAQAPEYTLRVGRGACRDLTTLFIASCRAQGLSARFVSGYQAAADTPDGQRHLHAWPEVLLPGQMPRAFDPTHGIEVTDGHIPLSAAPTQAETMPIEGNYSFQGSELTSTLRHAVHIDTSEPSARPA